MCVLHGEENLIELTKPPGEMRKHTRMSREIPIWNYQSVVQVDKIPR